MAARSSILSRGAWWATVHGVTKSLTQLSDYTTIFGNREVMDVVLLWDAMIWTRSSHNLVSQKL